MWFLLGLIICSLSLSSCLDVLILHARNLSILEIPTAQRLRFDPFSTVNSLFLSYFILLFPAPRGLLSDLFLFYPEPYARALQSFPSLSTNVT